MGLEFLSLKHKTNRNILRLFSLIFAIVLIGVSIGFFFDIPEHVAFFTTWAVGVIVTVIIVFKKTVK
ncbi:Uncharacterised protein [Yersinia kristensenii]|uniref:hypothetical protein n=1 Tax=Yersinia rochesterensis TaxID=1604335 RepID=UPI0005E5C695|nr:hypothetical protein [Yersinia rochesterensis]MDR5020234.1 hypothetical protein [Yersinia rochesterensis]CNI08281.1 Uncharacterised protein [Yersinia kristensenii]